MLASIIFCNFVNASYRDISINENYITNNWGNVNPGPSHEVGTIVFSSFVTNYTTYDIVLDNNTGQYVPLSINVYDYVRLSVNASKSIVLIDGVLQPGQSRQIINPGQYTYQETTADFNSTARTGTITVSNLPYKHVVINTDQNKPYALTFTPSVFDVLNETVVEVNVTTTYDILPGVYVAQTHFTYDNNDIRRDYNITINSFRDFHITSADCVNYVQLGTANQLCTVKIQNTGNDYFYIDMQPSDSIRNVVYVPQTLLSYPAYQQTVIVLYDTSKLGQALNYSGTLEFRGHTNTTYLKSEFVNVSFVVNDSTPPQITACTLQNFSTYQAADSIIVGANVRDNVAVSNVWGIITHRGTSSAVASVPFTKYGGDLYTGNWSTLQIDNYDYYVYANDSNGNVIYSIYPFQVVQRNPYNAPQTIQFDKVRFDRYTKEEIVINITQPIDNLKMYVSQMNYVGNWEFLIREEKTGNQKVISHQNTSTQMPEYDISTTGTIYISFKGSTTGLYNGEIRFTAPDYAIQLPPITFLGEVITYDLPQPFQDNNFYGGSISCIVKDTGSYNDSKYICSMEFPITADIRTTAVPVSADMKKKAEEQWQAKVDVQKTRGDRLWIVVIGYTGLLLILSFVSYWAIFQYPFIRNKWK